MDASEGGPAFPWTSAAAFTFWDIPDDWGVLPSWSELGELYKFQAGRCAMCGYTADLVVDHDHDTELVRGLLCRSCNSTEPHNDHEAWRLWRAGVTPMARLGMEVKYSAPFYYGKQPTISDEQLARAMRDAWADEDIDPPRGP